MVVRRAAPGIRIDLWSMGRPNSRRWPGDGRTFLAGVDGRELYALLTRVIVRRVMRISRAACALRWNGMETVRLPRMLDRDGDSTSLFFTARNRSSDRLSRILDRGGELSIPWSRQRLQEYVGRFVDGREHSTENAQSLGFLRLARDLGEQWVSYRERLIETENTRSLGLSSTRLLQEME